MIPRAHPLDVDPHGNPLVQHHLDKRPHLVGIRAHVTLENADADLPQRVRIVDNHACALERDTAEGVVGQAVFDEAAGPVITPQILDLL